jgi:hypothetical protein
MFFMYITVLEVMLPIWTHLELNHVRSLNQENLSVINNKRLDPMQPTIIVYNSSDLKHFALIDMVGQSTISQ